MEEAKEEARPASVAKPAEQAEKEEPGEEAGEDETPDAEEQEEEQSRMHVLGHDDNIRTKSLKDLPKDQVGCETRSGQRYALSS